MSDRFQDSPNQPPMPFRSGDDYEDREVYLRKPNQGGIPGGFGSSSQCPCWEWSWRSVAG